MDNLENLREDILKCTRCELRQGCTAPVCGDGDVGAKYFIIGEAPGKEEDEAGQPFIGKAGRNLGKLLALAGISENDCYYSNTVRCRPPGNRDPKKKEIAACVDYLWREIDAVQPEMIITVGRYSLGLFRDEGVTKLHGTKFDVEINGKTYPVWCHYHPAAEFRNPRLRADILEDWQHPAEKVDHSYIVHGVKKKLNLNGMPLAAVDTESVDGNIGQWSAAYRDGQGKLSVSTMYGINYDIEWGNCPIVFHNAKYDTRELAAAHLPMPEKFHDTMIMAYCLGLGKQAPKDSSKFKSGSNMVGGLGLKYLARRQLGMDMKTWKQVKDAPPEEMQEYNANDSVATYLLAEKWLPILPKHYFEIDMPLLPVIMAMEDRGIKIDVNFLQQFAKELDNRLADFDDVVQHLAYHNADLQSYVYGTLGIEPWRFSEGGAPSVDAEALESIDDPIVNDILRYKGLYKDKGTYVDSYVKGRDENDRIHSEFKQTSTFTGRLSCANPNLQNVDKKGNMRKLFIASPGMKIIRMDWKLAEFGMLAVLAGDEKLIEAFLHEDVHQINADAVNATRDIGKHFTFLMQNGGTAWGMSQTYGVPLDLAKKQFDAYFEKFPALKKFQDKTVADTYANGGFVVGHWGRRRRVDALFASDWRVRKDGEKEAKTMPMQNGTAEMCKLAMIDLHNKFDAPMILQVHDEILFEVPEKEAEDYAHWLREYVPTITPVKGIQFPVDVTIGNNWWECCQE